MHKVFAIYRTVISPDVAHTLWMEPSDAALRNKLCKREKYELVTEATRVPGSKHTAPHNGYSCFYVKGADGTKYRVFSDHSANLIQE